MTFDDIIPFILQYEGGYVNDPRDPGGETRYGISKRAYPNIDIKSLSKEAAIEIYRHDYWMKIKGDYLPQSLRLMMLDSAVNLGVFRAAYIPQGVVGVKQDGIIGRITLEALTGLDDLRVLIDFAMARHKYYTRLPTWKVFGRGWSKRLLDIGMISASRS